MSFITYSPQGDGNLKVFAASRPAVAVSSPIPRKGTETGLREGVKLDPNLLFHHLFPARGRKLFFDETD